MVQTVGAAAAMLAAFFVSAGCTYKKSAPPAVAKAAKKQAAETARRTAGADDESASAEEQALGHEPAAAGSPAAEVAGESPAGDSSVAEASAGEAPVDAAAQNEGSSALGRELYARHCAACHGANGDGQGLAAAFLYPKPRNFRLGKFRLSTAASGIPSRADWEAMLLRGMPGSSMPPWAHLPAEHRSALVDEVVRLWKEGLKDRYVAMLKEQDELTDEEIAEEEVQADLRQFVQRQTTPEDSPPPPEVAVDDGALARGKEHYFKQNCNKCHGEQGKGDGQEKMVDDEGYVMRPRDLTLGIFKGGHDFASIYYRIANGMPGTPMPSSSKALMPEQMGELAHYVRSLSTEEVRESAAMKRQQLVALKVAQTPGAVDAKDWDQIAAVAISMTPLWWRDNADPHLQVQAAHDGTTLALRLAWRDGVCNDRAVGPDEFEDMAAAEFTQGAEPFLGMGAADTPVDLWQWRGGVRQTGAEDSLFDEYPFDMPIYDELTKGQTVPDFLTARAAGNPLAVRDRDAGNLAAKGFGSTTFRPKASQIVSAQAAWSDGRWTLLLTRPLNVSSEDGLSLSPGSQASVAFAIWDGAAHDRGPQKLISIWNDLRIE